MAATTVGSIQNYFRRLKDPRVVGRSRHLLVDIIVLAICGVIADCDDWHEIALFAQKRLAWFKRFLQLPHGVPSHDTFERVFSKLEPRSFQGCCLAWLRAVADSLGMGHIAIDGKTLCVSAGSKWGPFHLVSAWATWANLTLGQVAVEGKSNEITAIPERLALVNIPGAIITIDAMGTQKAIAAQIIDRQADYVLALKGNQETLHQAVIDYIDQQMENAFAHAGARRLLTTEQGHGRQETRSYVQMPVPPDLADLELWKGLRTIGVATLACVRDGMETTETRYYISSLGLGVKRFAHAIRSHWGIENSCHWSLDFTFREDESRIRHKNLRENFAWINRFLLSLLKQHTGKDSIVMRRRACGWDENFLLQILTGATP